MAGECLARPVMVEDLPAIHAIYHHSVLTDTASWELTPPDEGEMGRRMQTVLDGGYPYFVAEVDGRVVGYAYASSYRPRPGYRFTVEDSIYVADGLRGRGVGRQLLNQVIRACEERGFRQMIAVIGDSQNLASIHLHRTLGFAQVGLLPNLGYKFGRWLDIVLMQRPLGAGATTAPIDR
jgi:L-amino acid N-acyltransferase YncA